MSTTGIQVPTGAISVIVAGVWAFLGGIVRGSTDWKDPSTGKFSLIRFGVAVVTALVLGQLALAFGQHNGWEPTLTNALASVGGYLGPAASMQFFRKRILGDDDAKSKE